MFIFLKICYICKGSQSAILFPWFDGISNIFGVLLYINYVIINDMMTGGRGVKNGPKKDDVIYVQPLKGESCVQALVLTGLSEQNEYWEACPNQWRIIYTSNWGLNIILCVSCVSSLIKLTSLNLHLINSSHKKPPLLNFYFRPGLFSDSN